MFGDEVGGPLASIKTTWRTACGRTGVVDLHDVRDVLGHTNLTTTSRYLRSTAMRPECALRLLEESQAASERTPPMVREGDLRRPLPGRRWRLL